MLDRGGRRADLFIDLWNAWEGGSFVEYAIALLFITTAAGSNAKMDDTLEDSLTSDS
jgi:hypothetical protein